MNIIVLNFITGSVDILILSDEQTAQCNASDMEEYLNNLGYPTSNCQWMACSGITAINILGHKNIKNENIETEKP